MPELTVTFKNASGNSLVGKLVDTGAQDTVVLCHGYAGSKDGFHLPEIAQQLARRNMCSLRFDFSGNGDSSGEFKFANYLEEVEDLRAAVEFLRSMKKKVEGIVGHSKGGNVVMLYAGIYDDVPNVINIAGRFEMASGVRERFGEEVMRTLERDGHTELKVKTDRGNVIKYTLTLLAVQDRMKLDMKPYVQKITMAEVLTIHGDADTVIPPADANLYAQHTRNHTLVLVPGGDHNFKNQPAAQTLIKKVVDFLVAGR